MRLKRIDSMLLKGFVPPFLLSFLMALFVLVMQTLWLYIDDILGKGAGLLIIVEFLVYLSFSLIPLALPIGVLLAGVFLFGNLGERYELSSMKTAGISLFRIMMPLVFFSLIVCAFSWICSDYINPKANLKFLSRLHDLKRQKPTLSLEEGVFNEDFYGYIIRIGKKAFNGRDISDILIYDHNSNESSGGKTIISAVKGTMSLSKNTKLLIMKLQEGIIYQDPGNQKPNTQYPFIRTSFNELTKVFDLEEFELDRSDEDIFKNNQRMKNTRQLQADVDSLDNQIRKNILPVFKRDEKFKVAEERMAAKKKTGLAIDTTLLKFRASIDRRQPIQQFVNLDSLHQVWQNRGDSTYLQLYTKAHDLLHSEMMQNSSFNDGLRSLRNKKSKFEYELYLKYSLAFVCLIFIFIGAPLGAIVKKGGYGYPLILCILVFVSYILLNTFCKRLSEGLSITGSLAAWIPCLVMLIPAIALSWSAMRDRNIFNDISLILRRLRS